MRETVKAKEMIDYLTEEWKIAHKYLEKLGENDERAQMRTSWCIGMKEMTEALIGEPVNLRLNGTVVIGFDE